ncbi:hypothetical protein WJX72_000333 [[Myrmecia] bisecta]|uniref:Uncharacterized protein n=1 Tax=[Myrmecia] bisecta TaxID=41462 RepID=A0AAW1QE05_9CHLO
MGLPVKHSRWKPGPLWQLRAFLLSTPFQTGAQLASGELLLSFFFWHSSIRFKANCLASTLYLVGSLLLAQNNLLGSKTLACAFVVGSTWLAALLAGCVVSLARLANNHGFTALLCILGSVGLLPFAAIRCSENHVVGHGFGILTNIAYGNIIIQGELLWPKQDGAKTFWNLLVSHIMLDACIAAGCMLFSAALVLPTLAGDELRTLLAKSVRGVGQSVSGYGSCIFAPFGQDASASSPHKHAAPTAVCTTGPAGVAVRLQARTEPGGKGLAKHHPQHHAADAIRPLLEQARAAIIMSGLEPAWLHSVYVDPAKWTAVINALDSLVTHVAACEMLVDEWHLMAARLFQHDWAGMEAQLHEALHGTMRSYTDQVVAISHEKVQAPLSLMQLRALAFTTTISQGIIASMRKLEAAVAAALLLPSPVVHTSPDPSPDPPAGTLTRRSTFQALAGGVALDPVLLEQDDAKTEAAAMEQPPAKGATSEPEPPNPTLTPGTAVSDVELGKMLACAYEAPSPSEEVPAQSGKGVKLAPAGATAAPAAAKPARGIKYYFGFLVVPVTMLACLPAMTRIVDVFGRTLPSAMFSGTAARSLLSDRSFQFGAKFWFTMSCVMIGAVILQQDHAPSRHWSTQYAFLTVIIVFSERVEMTVSKGFLRVLGTLVGGSLGLLVMFDASLATNAVPLAVIVVACTWMAGIASASPFKLAVTLTIITFNVQVLCQFVGCCAAHGTLSFYLGQAVAIVIGTVFVILVNNCVLPWYASSSALGMLGGALTGSSQLLGEYYESFYQAVRASAAAARTLDAGAGDLTAAPVKLPPNAIRMRVGQPLSRVQTMLAKERVAWTFQRLGILTMPPIVRAVLDQLLPLMDRLSALELSVLQHPAITGAFHSSAIWDHFVLPMNDELQASFGLAQTLAQTAAEVLQSGNCKASQVEIAARVKDLRGSIQELEQQRVAMRRHHLQCRRNFFAALRGAAPDADGRLAFSTLFAYDDCFRFQSWLFSVIKVLDTLTMVGKTVAGAGDQCRPAAFAWLFAQAA